MKLHQIYEDDLADLERMLPELCEEVTMRPSASPRHKRMVRVVQRIIRDVRWNYGPPDNVTEIETK